MYDLAREITKGFGPTVSVNDIPTKETRGKVIEDPKPSNIIGQIMKRICKADKILTIEVKKPQYWTILHTLGFDVSYHDLVGEDEFDFPSKTFTRLICIDGLPRIENQEMFLRDCLSKLQEGGLGLFFFHVKYLTDDLKQYLKIIKCPNLIRLMPSRLDSTEMDTCLIEVIRCKKEKTELPTLTDVMKNEKKE